VAANSAGDGEMAGYNERLIVVIKWDHDDPSAAAGSAFMLAIHGQPKRLCNGFARRDLLQAAGVGMLWTSLPLHSDRPSSAGGGARCSDGGCD